MITRSHPSEHVQRQQTEPRKMLTVPMFVAGLALSVAGLIGGHIASKSIANLAHFNANTPFTLRGF
ncbi:hypothetical protein [Sulfitobacter sp. 1A12157]|uniref:hypothetical protein n=1 Tax=Sulfitobacter sp. 1A12157 TaxID=3368594 RepID=UPI003745B9ED